MPSLISNWNRKVLRRIAGAVLVSFLVLSPRSGGAQSKPASAAEPKLTEPAERGRGIFGQRCALCHLPKIQKPRTVPAMAPPLEGLLKNAAPTKETAVRNQILKGSPNMPGFQYGLEAKELDDLIAYLKTL